MRAGRKLLVHATYLDTLPTWEQLRTPLHFTSSELDIFKGTNLYGAALDRDHLWRIEWTACQSLVAGKNANWANLFTWSVVLSGRTNKSEPTKLITCIGRDISLQLLIYHHEHFLPLYFLRHHH
jgi:hypothetical protein